jgi:serine protease Do
MNSTELRNHIASTSPGTTVRLTILRDGKEKEISVTLGELPEEQPVAQRSETSVEKVGISVANISESMIDRYNLQVKDKGVVVTEVQQGSVAAQSGIRPGDVILSVNRKKISNVNEYNAEMEDIKSGDTVLFYVQRGEGKIFIAFEIPGK